MRAGCEPGAGARARAALRMLGTERAYTFVCEVKTRYQCPDGKVEHIKALLLELEH